MIAQYLSTGGSDLVWGTDPTSGRSPLGSNQIYGLHRDIHIIHRPYYYYESHLLLLKNLEIKWYILYNEKDDLLRGKHFCLGRIRWM
jgi:hypothetical protein